MTHHSFHIQDVFHELIVCGFRIIATSCSCGGLFAWYVERDSGAYECMGCICHTDPIKLREENLPAPIVLRGKV